MEISYSKKRQSMGPAPVMVQKTPVSSTRMSMSYGGPAGGNVISRQTVSRSYAGRPGGMLALKPGTASTLSKESVGAVLSNRGKEKAEMTDLNDRFASYIEKVRFLEATNKNLGEELTKLRKMKGYTQDRVKELYEDELKECRETIKELSKKCTPLESKIVALQDELDTKDLELEDSKKHENELSTKVDQLSQMCGDLEGELALLRRTVDNLQSENNKQRTDIENLRNDNNRIRDDCEEAVTAQLNAANEAKCIEDDAEFKDKAYNAEINELRELLAQHKSNLPKMQETWSGEFKTALRQLKEEYDSQIARISDETRRSYEDQLIRIKSGINRDETDAAMVKSEVKTLKSALNDKKAKHGDLVAENERLRQELDNLRKEFERECRECEEEKGTMRSRILDLEEDLEGTMEDLKILQDKKMSLEMEILTYRSLLTGCESSLKGTVQGQVQSKGAADLAGIIAGDKSQQQSTMSESTGMVRVTRSSKCAVTVQEVSQDGSYILLENTSQTKDYDLSNHKLERKCPKGTYDYKFGKFTLGKGKTIKIYGAAYDDDEKDEGSLVSKCKNWGVGNGHARLLNAANEERCGTTIAYK